MILRKVKSFNGGELTIKMPQHRAKDGTLLVPDELKELVPKGANFAYDVQAKIVEMRYVELRQRSEIQSELAKNDIDISTGSISNLSREGLAGLEQLQLCASQRLGEFYRQNDAFILHLDGTQEGGDWCHFVIREGFSGHILLSRKIRTEHSDDIAPMLAEIKNLYGFPDAIISDMSKPISTAIKAVFPLIPHRYCHYHFLKAVGTAWLEAEHNSLGSAVKKTKKQLHQARREIVAHTRNTNLDLRNAINLIDWIFKHSENLHGKGFPFDLAHLQFHENCGEALKAAQLIENKFSEVNSKAVLSSIRLMIEALQAQKNYSQDSINTLNNLNNTFAELRDIMVPSTDDGQTKTPLNWGMLDDTANLVDTKQKLKKFTAKIKKRSTRENISQTERKRLNGLHKRLAESLNKLEMSIFVRGKTVILPRTNNAAEIGFRDFKRRSRRTTGAGNLARQLDQTPAQAFYAENLQDDNFCKIVFNGQSFAEALGKTDRSKIRETTASMKTPKTIGAVDYKAIKQEDFLERLIEEISSSCTTKNKKCA